MKGWGRVDVWGSVLWVFIVASTLFVEWQEEYLDPWRNPWHLSPEVLFQKKWREKPKNWLTQVYLVDGHWSGGDGPGGGGGGRTSDPWRNPWHWFPEVLFQNMWRKKPRIWLTQVYLVDDHGGSGCDDGGGGSISTTRLWNYDFMVL